MDGEAFCSLIHNRREVEVASDRKSWTVVLRETWLLCLDMAYFF
jgi:hypothetical protein